MLINKNHLTYCMNIHSGNSWNDMLNAIEHYVVPIKQEIAPATDFGLGLRLGAEMVSNISESKIASFKKMLSDYDMYVFTVNAFPYGVFHKKPLKKKVYLPDWGEDDRLIYTKNVAETLAKILPENINGTISTIPVTYGKNLPSKSIANIISIAKFLAELDKTTGKKIILTFEPEPDCYIEATQDTIDFFKLLNKNISEKMMQYLGICLDTCHFALQFEDPLKAWECFEKNGINVPKIQLSAALRYSPKKTPSFSSFADSAKNELEKYAEDVYLHQTRIKKDSRLFYFHDLSDALKNPEHGEWRIHFHVPLYKQKYSETLFSTSDSMNTNFFAKIAAFSDLHLEIETYSFNVIPKKEISIIKSIEQEYCFILNKLSTANTNP
ncbi:MAG: metabolite traffic protein EboE [Verrucomicrobiota bacterium]|nr:metabolite traffic protein EboE [Verrucomicrobiota bacterium]